MGWCSVGTSGEPCDVATCNEIHGNWSDERPSGCLLLSHVEDEIARGLIVDLVYPPYLRLRDEILPVVAGGPIIRDLFEQHYRELVSLIGRDPALLRRTLDVMVEWLPFVAAMGGGRTQCTAPFGLRPSGYTAAQVRPGPLRELFELSEQLESGASDELRTTLTTYRRLLSGFEGFRPEEVLTAIRMLDTSSAQT